MTATCAGPVGAPAHPPDPPDPCGGPVRLTWVQPEDLVGHEFRQAAEDGRAQAAEPLLRVWLSAGGHLAPTHAGASPTPAAPRLRALATDLLTALDALPRPWANTEPDPWPPATTTRPEGGAGAGAGAGARAGGWIGAGAGAGAGFPGAAPGPAPAPHARPGAAPTARPGGSPHPVAGPGAPGSPAGAAGPEGPAAQSGTGPRAAAPGGVTARRDAAPAVDSALRRRLEAAWLGRAVGCVLGKPVEKLPLHGIRALARAAGNWPLDDWFTERGVPPEVLAAHPWNRRSAPTSLAENIDGAPEDDDLNYPLLGLLLLRRHGRGFTTADVGRLWLDELPAGRTFTAERVAYRNLLQGLEPPATATHHNPFREWIGALIRADVHGWTNPGAPAAAAAQAYRDAALTHTGNGVYAALFVAAATATAATGRADVHTALRAGLAVVPPRSRLAEAVRSGIAAAGREPDFDAVVDHLHARYGHYHWVHAVPNTALIAAALTHADGDFTRSVCHAVSGGWDTDSNGATAGALAGLIAGSPDAVPHRWTAPLKNRLATSVPGFDGIGFDALAHLTAQEAARP
ncbi:ADP-ribosylglycohydrolase family protein [Streptomyces sp. H27-H1]|uniref:ADP-ribosylglycohydrolase family protein n=1 Tax=Streptomyces sp. H27-H1 TaxID=2996461 RepID=UPI0022713A1E|nr:ADP-ribosylglycohydrolase family protein [Streptomyces sp. H27-H1]MCY0926412.1 ADP-ribosylglycohydrolase family protein [Streptomyces sp. H27-H1]